MYALDCFHKHQCRAYDNANRIKCAHKHVRNRESWGIGWVCIWYGGIEAAKSVSSPPFDMQSDWCYINKLKCWEYNFTPFSPRDWSDGEINNRIYSNHRKWRKCKMKEKHILNNVQTKLWIVRRRKKRWVKFKILNANANAKHWKGRKRIKIRKKSFFSFLFLRDGRGNQSRWENGHLFIWTKLFIGS